MSKIRLRVSNKTIDAVLRGEVDEPASAEADMLGKMLGLDVEDSPNHQVPVVAKFSPTPKQLMSHIALKKEITGFFGNENENPTTSPELSYTPGKSRLDTISMARLKVLIYTTSVNL